MQLSAVTARPAVRASAPARARSVRASASLKEHALPIAAAATAAALFAAVGPALAGEALTFEASKGAVQGLDVAAVQAAAAALAAPKAAAVAAAASSAGSGLGDLFSDNPVAGAGLVAAGLGLPAGLIALLRGGGGSKGAAGAKATGAAQAVEALAAGRAVLVDIRSKEEVREYGSPKLPAGKKMVSLPFTKV